MALRGIKVVELAGLAPAPFCGMILSDFGASVIRVDKIGHSLDLDCLDNGKKSISLNLKHNKGIEVFRRLCKHSDVLIEPFRKGVMEKLGLGPEVLLQENKRLIYARLSGFGRKGVYAERAGHDINFVALSGLLSMFGWEKNKKPSPPLNLIADFAGGGLMCAFGIVTSLLEREKSGLGQVVDCSMVEGAAYLGSWIYRSQHLPIWGKARAENTLDGGASFYDTFETKDGKYMAVGPIEPQFYNTFLKYLKVTREIPQFSGDMEANRSYFESIFKQKTREEWCQIFDGHDACVTPVLTLDEAPKHRHNVENGSFNHGPNGKAIPRPAPILSRTPAETKAFALKPELGQHTEEILIDIGYSKNEIETFDDLGTIMRNKL
ncbi:alpha-methylacyl-CoA racemase isoform X2 [Lycorma delicatula]